MSAAADSETEKLGSYVRGGACSELHRGHAGALVVRRIVFRRLKFLLCRDVPPRSFLAGRVVLHRMPTEHYFHWRWH